MEQVFLIKKIAGQASRLTHNLIGVGCNKLFENAFRKDATGKETSSVHIVRKKPPLRTPTWSGLTLRACIILLCPVGFKLFFALPAMNLMGRSRHLGFIANI